MAKLGKKTRQKIDRKMNIGELVAKHPELAQVLSEDYGLHCAGCFAASFDTLEQGAKVHGFDDKEIEEMISRLEKKVEGR